MTTQLDCSPIGRAAPERVVRKSQQQVDVGFEGGLRFAESLHDFAHPGFEHVSAARTGNQVNQRLQSPSSRLGTDRNPVVQRLPINARKASEVML
jgi:hypothetical protein